MPKTASKTRVKERKARDGKKSSQSLQPALPPDEPPTELAHVEEETNEPLDTALYERLLNQVPAECITVPIVMECLLEQVVAIVDATEQHPEDNETTTTAEPVQDSKFAEYDKFGRPDWGSTILQDGLKTLADHCNKQGSKDAPVGPTIISPLYIKNGDFASIQSCHLNETTASHIASTQVSGDLRNIQGLLEREVPEFNPGLYVKLLANLNHFMYFLPPEAINFEDMFFILHLLMSAGVEVQLQKEAAAAAAAAATIEPSAISTDEEQNKGNEQTESGVGSKPTASTSTVEMEIKKFDGTNLAKDHNYLVLSSEPEGVNFIMAPDPKTQVRIQPIGTNVNTNAQPQAEIMDGQQEATEMIDKVEPTGPQSSATYAAKKVMEAAAELANEEFPREAGYEDGDDDEVDHRTFNFGQEKSSQTHKFIACEEEWFKNLNDFSVFKALLECPALLAISESGALDSKWIETYLLSSGMKQTGGDGVLIGDLREWNFVEELVPIQTVQLLNDASKNYLSMQRMYCPFYDTLLFIFNNPVPKELKSDSQFFYKIEEQKSPKDANKVDDDIISTLMCGTGKIIDALSVTALMKIVPENQWLLVPSIKYMLYKQSLKPTEQKEEDESTVRSSTTVQSQFSNAKSLEKVSEKTKSKKGRKSSATESKKPKNNLRKSLKKKESKLEIKNEDNKNKENKEEEDEANLDTIPSFHLNEAIGQQMQQSRTVQAAAAAAAAKSAELVTGDSKTKFNFYDLGKPEADQAFASDTHHLFPMDGSIIQYELSTAEPDFRMMQLTLTKNGHQTFFYPSIVPQDKAQEDHVVVPYFHMVHKNGTIFAFQDRRATETTPYLRTALKRPTDKPIFSYDKVVFGIEADDLKGVSETFNTGEASGGVGTENLEEQPNEKKGRKGKNTKKDKQLLTVGKEEKKKKSKMEKKNKSNAKINTTTIGSALQDTDDEEKQQPTSKDRQSDSTPSGENGEWTYSEAELTDVEGETKKQFDCTLLWSDAEVLTEPMVQILKITLPSGLRIEVDDVEGPPRTREVKQTYSGRGSAIAPRETSRYYTMGSVVKFMQNGTIQILTAKGFTVNIRELVTSAQREEENLQELFQSANSVKIYNGDIIHPNGDFWHIVDGVKEQHDPIYVFTTGYLKSGEVFRRRQDGVVYMNRHDGTAITHYPDGTRFTTRIIVQTDVPEDLSEWVVIGLKYMTEHPHYSTVIYNTLSGNMHIRLPLGDWARVFADGSIKITTFDNYSMDVNQYRAVLSYPPCGADPDIPNLTAVKLWHSTGTNEVKKTEEVPEPPPNSAATTEVPFLDINTSVKKSMKSKQSKTSLQKYKRRGNPSSSTTSHKHLSLKDSTLKKEALSVEGPLDGETIDEEEEEGEYEEMLEAEVASSVMAEEVPPKNHPETPKESTKFDIQEFIQFSEANVLCKAVDSWGNRFFVDIHGSTVVERKAKENEDKIVGEFSTDHLIQTLSDHCQLPREFVSGILQTTSSENLTTAAKRLSALKKSSAEGCGLLGATKIFVVKKNLSGYEYFKESQVDKIVNRARRARESMVSIDPLPNHSPRKYITVMEPISESGRPRGTWTTCYREPVYRPNTMTSKQMKKADLRWFGYVLTNSTKKKPKFMACAKDYMQQHRAKKAHGAGDALLFAEGEDLGALHEVEAGTILEQSEDNKRGSKEGNRKSKKSMEKRKSKTKKSQLLDEEGGDARKSRKSVKSLGEKSRTLEEELYGEEVDGEGENEEQLMSMEEEMEHQQQSIQTKRLSTEKEEVGNYPKDVKDLKGIYDDGGEVILFEPQFHADILSEKKAIVVRSFVEIPQIDEKMQRALLAASMSYAKTVQTQLNVIELNKFHDPRSSEEKQEQANIKQELIQNNLSAMHLLEQRAGRVLRFHF